MSWNKLAPIAKSTGRPMTSASIVVNKDGTPKISLVIAGSLHDEYGERTKLDIMAGEGEHAGALLLEFNEAGAFDIKGFGKGGGRVFLPIPAGLPTKPTTNTACRLGERTADTLVVHLPVAQWDVEIAARSHRPIPAAPAPVVPKRPGAPETTLDVVAYLAGKGVKCDRLAGNRFQLRGEVVALGQVLKVVNEHRKSSDLDPLSLLQVH